MASGLVEPEKKRARMSGERGKIVTKRSAETLERFTFFFGRDCVFSQWHHAVFTVKGVQYNCAEQYMMHQKAVLFKDKEMGEKILQSHDPKEQKALGRMVRNFDPKVWDQNCKKIVKKGNLEKFSQNPELAEEMLKTKGTTLVEASPHDRIWGIGLGAHNPKATDRTQWKGKNWLGEILTQVAIEVEKQKGRKTD